MIWGLVEQSVRLFWRRRTSHWRAIARLSVWCLLQGYFYNLFKEGGSLCLLLLLFELLLRIPPSVKRVGIAQSAQLAAGRQRNRIVEVAVPALRHKHSGTSCNVHAPTLFRSQRTNRNRADRREAFLNAWYTLGEDHLRANVRLHQIHCAGGGLEAQSLVALPACATRVVVLP